MGLDNLLTGFLVTTSLWFLTWDDHFVAKTIRDKRVLITCTADSCAGVGEQLAYEYSRLGARLLLAATSAAPSDGVVASRCRELGAADVHVAATDLSEVADRAALVAEVVTRLGGIDHLVMLDYESGREQTGPASSTYGNDSSVNLQDDFRSNFVTHVDLAARLLPMLERSGGHLGLVTSLAGKIGVPGRAEYSANRFALHGYFSSLRQLLARNESHVSVSLGLLTVPDVTSGESVEQSAANSILQGVSVRAREIYAGRLSYLLVNAHAMFPSYVERYLMSY